MFDLPLDLNNNTSPSVIGGSSATLTPGNTTPFGWSAPAPTNDQPSILPTGAATGPASSNTTPSSGGGPYGGFATKDQWFQSLGLGQQAPVGWNGPSIQSAQDQQRGAINSGYDSYFNSLNDMLNNGLPQQRDAQNTIANSQYDQGVNNLTTQKNLGAQDLQTQRTQANTNQAKSLQDLHNNIQNLFQSGNVYLGARGAADSSAANQYSYALTKMGSKQQGDLTNQYAQIQNDINGRESRLNEIYNGQVQNLSSQRDQQIAGIAQWFSQQQNALKQAQASGQLQKGQDLASLSQNYLNYALQQLQSVQQQAAAQKSQLDQWAMNHSQDINQLKSNLSQVSNTNYQMPQATALGGISGGGGQASPNLLGFGQTGDQTKTNIFGQPIA